MDPDTLSTDPDKAEELVLAVTDLTDVVCIDELILSDWYFCF
jgi:hypothetical protein